MQLFLAFVFLLSPVEAHKFYVSLTDVSYNESSKHMEVSSKYFIDDLEMALELGPNKHIIMPMDEALLPKMRDYMAEHFRLTIDGRPCALELLGYELEDDVVWIYLESGEISSFGNVEVTANQLTELFDQQQNIVHVSNGKELKSLFLRKESQSGNLTFE